MAIDTLDSSSDVEQSNSVTFDTTPSQKKGRGFFAKLFGIGRGREQMQAITQITPEQATEASREIPSGSALSEFTKKIDAIDDRYLVPGGKEEAKRMLIAAEGVKDVFMGYSEDELRQIQEAFGTHLTDVVINTECVKAGKLNIKDLKIQKTGGIGKTPNSFDNKTAYNHLHGKPLEYLSVEDDLLLHDLAEKTGISYNDLVELRGLQAQGGYGETMIVTPNNLGMEGEETDSLSRATALGIDYPNEAAREAINEKLTTIHATDRFGHTPDIQLNIAIDLPPKQRDLAHYAVAVSTLKAQYPLGQKTA